MAISAAASARIGATVASRYAPATVKASRAATKDGGATNRAASRDPIAAKAATIASPARAASRVARAGVHATMPRSARLSMPRRVCRLRRSKAGSKTTRRNARIAAHGASVAKAGANAGNVAAKAGVSGATAARATTVARATNQASPLKRCRMCRRSPAFLVRLATVPGLQSGNLRRAICLQNRRPGATVSGRSQKAKSRAAAARVTARVAIVVNGQTARPGKKRATASDR